MRASNTWKEVVAVLALIIGYCIVAGVHTFLFICLLVIIGRPIYKKFTEDEKT